MGHAAAALKLGFPDFLAAPSGKLSKQKQTSQPFFGHCYSTVADGFATLSKLVGNSDSLHSLMKFCVSLSEAVSPALYIEKFTVTVANVDTWIDGVRIFHDIRKLATLHFVDSIKQGRYSELLSDATFLVADTSAMIHLGGFLNLVDLGAKAASYGAIGLYGQGVAFAFVGLQCALDIRNGNLSDENVVWLACSILEVLHKVVIAAAAAALLGPTAGVVAAGWMGMIANGVGIYAEYHYPETHH